MPDLARTNAIIDLLQQTPQTVESIIDHFKKSGDKLTPRQIRPIIKAIRKMDLGGKFSETTGPANRKSWHIRQTDDDRNGKWLIRGVLPRVFSQKRQELLYKLNAWLESEEDPIIDSTHFYETEAHDDLDNQLKTVIRAIDEGRKLTINELSGDSTSVRSLIEFPLVVFPIKIIYHRGCFYVAAVADETRHRVLTFQVDQLTLEAGGESFDWSMLIEIVEADLKKRFGVTQNIDDEEYDIVLRFSSVTGAFINKQFWNNGMNCTEDGDGWLITFQGGINRELVGWIFQWMSNVRVVGPPKLKQLYDEQLARMLGITEQLPDDPIEFSNAFAPEK